MTQVEEGALKLQFLNSEPARQSNDSQSSIKVYSGVEFMARQMDHQGEGLVDCPPGGGPKGSQEEAGDGG